MVTDHMVAEFDKHQHLIHNVHYRNPVGIGSGMMKYQSEHIFHHQDMIVMYLTFLMEPIL